ncbi:MAG: tetratricopeptide repeat protein [Desulfobulbaceae bacterium]|nr:tetratricopeptide repeat protein [Desulfobulbaceae bacterium]
MKCRKLKRLNLRIKSTTKKDLDADLLKNLAIQHYRAGRLRKAIKYYQKAAHLIQNDANLYNNIGMLYNSLGEKQKEKSSYKYALAVEPDHAQANYNLGNLCQTEGYLDEAISYYERALKVNPANADCFNNLGNIYKEKKRYTEALYCYRRTLAINPNQVETRINNGLIKFEQGNIDEAISSYLLALDIEPHSAEGHIYLADAVLVRDGFDEWKSIVDRGLRCPELNMTQKIDLLVSKAICAWLKGNLDKVKELLNEIEPFIDQFEEQGYLKNRKAYFNLIKALMRTGDAESVLKDSTLPKIHLIGDSHCLPSTNRRITYHDKDYICKSHLIIGCKSWHIGQERDNRYKYALKKIIEKIPESSLVVFVIGEIDCRVREGIYPYCIKNNLSFNSVIDSTVRGYVSSAIKIAKQKKIIPIFYGVAAPHIATLADIDLKSREMYLEVVRKFNEYLFQAVIEEGCEFLDTYKATRGENLISNQHFNIDECHMAPTFLQYCIEQFLRTHNKPYISPSS